MLPSINCLIVRFTKWPRVRFCQYDNCPSLMRRNENDCRKKNSMTNFNIRMVLDWKREPVTVWSQVSLTSHKVDTHTHARLHTRLVCETHIADMIVSKSCVLGQINFV